MMRLAARRCTRRKSTRCFSAVLEDVVIGSVARTPIGAFCGGLSMMPPQKLGAFAMGAAMRRAGLDPEEVEMVVFGHALTAGCGSNTVRQAALLAKIPSTVECFGVAMGCASGMKAITVAAQAIAMGQVDVAVAGGMESMSQVPYFLRHARRGGYNYGHGTLEDAAIVDGLWDSSSDCHLSACVEHTIQEMGLDRGAQDRYALQSYQRAANAWQRGAFDLEVAPVRVKNPRATPGSEGMEKRSMIVSVDEEYSRMKLDEMAKAPPCFQEDGTITAGNASSLNDGAAAVVLLSSTRAREMGIPPLARVASFADQAVDPLHVAKAPSAAISKALSAARMSSVHFYEIHETFGAVALVNMQLLDLDPTRVNINGGAVALGHPLGASGARIVVTLVGVLTQQDAETGCAAICSTGGGATAIVIERR
eukprot:symbB.v1.2.009319.t1/scaffold585.1/size314277/9